MSKNRSPKIAFIGAGSTVFMKNIVGDLLQREALEGARIALMDINADRLNEARAIACNLVSAFGNGASVSAHIDQRPALDGADFVVVAFQIGGYDPCTITDFEIPKKYGLRQTIADTLGIGGIMRGIRTVPHLWKLCEDMSAVCPNAMLLQYVNPMAINTWAIAAKFPAIRQVGLCHSVQGTACELAQDLGVSTERIRYRCAGINHMAFFLEFDGLDEKGQWQSLYPELHRAWQEGRDQKKNTHNPRCQNKDLYEIMSRLGYFVTESSEHFAEYVPWFIKRDRPDLIEKFGIPLDEYPVRCMEQIEKWKTQREESLTIDPENFKASQEYASKIMNSVWTGTPSVIYGNVPNRGYITSLPEKCAVEVPCMVDRNGIHPTFIGDLPPQLTSIMRSNINVQELTVAAILEERREHIYHAAMMDPHTGAELDLEQIWSLVDELIESHGDWLPGWVR
ncbi:MAG: alpha-glucosidase/alpha-galactosidase [Albidovulum sp.]|nr:alpha-glucosidase/alpha-galactosidase [Albidovulum sp.]